MIILFFVLRDTVRDFRGIVRDLPESLAFFEESPETQPFNTISEKSEFKNIFDNYD